MGTRNLTEVVFNGERKVAQYGQWDGYPSGQGVTILGFLSTPGAVQKLRDGLARVRFIDEERDKEFLAAYNSAAPTWSSDPDNRTAEQIRWFRAYISRDLGGEILGNVANSTDQEILLHDSSDFKANSSCEYSYTVDLDKMTLTVYAYRELAGTFDLNALPTEDDFLKALQPEDEDD